MTSRLKVLLPALLAGFAAGCGSMNQRSGNPLYDTSRDPVVFSSEEEIAMGAQALPGVLAQYKPYKDLALGSYVEGVGQRLAKASDRSDIPYHFTVVDSNEVNAFALPGGFVFITTGLLKNLKDEAQLGAVLGHEVGHVVQRHALKNLQRQMVLHLGVAGLTDLAGKDKTQLIQLAGTLGSNLLLLRNSREAELQADEEGMKNESRAGLDPAAMLEVQEMLASLNQAGGSPNAVAEMLATHPSGPERITQAKALLPKYKGPTARNAGPYLEAVRPLLAGKAQGAPQAGGDAGPRDY